MDPRIARTRAQLRQALLELARERSLDQIAVSDIAERAGVNRSTYYQHYSDKDTLLAEALDVTIEETAARVSGDLDTSHGRELLREYVQQVEDSATLYRRMLGGLGSATIQARMRERLEHVLLDNLDPAEQPLIDVPLDVLAASIGGACLGVIRVWLDLPDPRSVDQAVDWIWAVLDAHGAVPPDA